MILRGVPAVQNGRVYLVDDPATSAIYALKAIHAEMTEGALARDRFRREAKLWIDLERHPYLVRAFFVEEIQGQLHLAMEYIAPDENGRNSLEGWLKHRPPDFTQSLRWGIQFCHGMEHAHARGVRSHRDIKPSNILIGSDRAVRIADVGIAVAQPTGALSGAPHYTSPEQFRDASHGDARSDIYSFGVVLFQMAALGKLPFVPSSRLDGPDGGARAWRELEHLHRDTTCAVSLAK